MIHHYVEERVMLPRPLHELYENVREFVVAVERGKLAGCAALKLYSEDVAEIRSLCVAPGLNSRGLGRALTARLLHEAQRFRLKTVFALTTVPEFFLKCGFSEVVRETFPMKIRRDCLQCEKYPACGEKTMVLDLSRMRPSAVASSLSAADGPAEVRTPVS